MLDQINEMPEWASGATSTPNPFATTEPPVYPAEELAADFDDSSLTIDNTVCAYPFSSTKYNCL